MSEQQLEALLERIAVALEIIAERLEREQVIDARRKEAMKHHRLFSTTLTNGKPD